MAAVDAIKARPNVDSIATWRWYINSSDRVGLSKNISF